MIKVFFPKVQGYFFSKNLLIRLGLVNKNHSSQPALYRILFRFINSLPFFLPKLSRKL